MWIADDYFITQGLRHTVKSYTVDKLKQILTGLSEENGVNLPKNGKKQDLIDRITQELDRYRYNRDLERWSRARGVLHQVRASGMCVSILTNLSATFILIYAHLLLYSFFSLHHVSLSCIPDILSILLRQQVYLLGNESDFHGQPQFHSQQHARLSLCTSTSSF